MQNSQHTSFPVYSLSGAPLHRPQENSHDRPPHLQKHHNKHHPVGLPSASHNARLRVRSLVPAFPGREAHLPPSAAVSVVVPDSSLHRQAQNYASHTRMSTRSVGAANVATADNGSRPPDVHRKVWHARRQISDSSVLTSSTSGSDDSAPLTPVSPLTRHNYPWFPLPLKTGSVLARTRHAPLTRPTPQTPCLTESGPYSFYPDSRPLYAGVYSPAYPTPPSVPPQAHQSANSFAAPTQATSVYDGGDMGSPSLLHVHATAWSTGGEQTLERAKEEIRVEDEVMEEVTHTQSQPQPESLGPLLSVSNGSGPEPIPRPVSAPPVFPHSGLESDRRDVEEEAAVGSANDHGDYRASCYLPTTSALNDSALQPLTTPPRDHEQIQAQVLAELARMHNFTPRPELRPFPDSHPYLYYLFPPPPTAALIVQAVVHPTLASINLTSKADPEITGTRGRRTAWSERSGMRVGEVKGPMYENVPLIDVRTGVVHYPGAGHTCVMTGGVRIGSCAEEEREVMELLEAMEIDEHKEVMGWVEGADVRRPGTPIPERPMPHLPSTPVRPLPPHLFDHHQHRAQNGYAYASPPGSPVHIRRATLAQYEYPQAAQQTPGMVMQPLQPLTRHNSPVQHRRPSSHLANEYFPRHQPPCAPGTGTGVIEEPTPTMRPMYGYYPGFQPSYSPAVYAVPMPPPSSPAPYMAPALPSYVPANPYTPQPSPGPYAWYGMSGAGNVYTPAVADANANMNGYFPPPSAAALPAAPVPDTTPSLELGLSTTAPDSKSTPQIFYTEQELESHFLKDPELSVPTMPTLRDAPYRPKRGTKRAIGKQPTIGLDGNINRSGVFGTQESPDEAYAHPDPSPGTAGIERPASVPPTLDDDTMNGVEVEVEVGARANRKRKRGQLAWDYRHEKGGGEDGEDGEGVSDDEVMLSADERKRARIGHCGSTRRRSFGDDEKRPGSAMRTRLAY